MRVVRLRELAFFPPLCQNILSWLFFNGVCLRSSNLIKVYWKQYSSDEVYPDAVAHFYTIGEHIRKEAVKIDAVATLNMKIHAPLLVKLTLQIAEEAGVPASAQPLTPPASFDDVTAAVVAMELNDAGEPNAVAAAAADA